MVFIHANLINFLEFFWIFLINLSMPHCSNFFNHFLFVRCDKRVIKVANTENNTSHAPNISFWVVLRSIEHFGGLISQSSNIFDNWWKRIGLGRYSKISYLNRVIFVFQKNIAWLEISMNDFNLMQILNR